MHGLHAPSTTTAPLELRQWDQWVCWVREDRGNGTIGKKPINPRTGEPAKSNNPETWSSYETAIAAAEEHGYEGVGFVFTADDPFCAVDLDDCIDPETGEVFPWALEIVEALDSYTELSPSGAGLHIYARASKPDGGCKKALEGGGKVEVYKSGRFLTITGRLYSGDAVEERQAELEALYYRLFPAEEEESAPGLPPAGKAADLDDQALLSKMRHGWGKAPRFRKLYDEGDWKGCGHPSPSEAEMELCGMLAFWTGCDLDRMDRFFRRSALMRAKWDSVRRESTYGRLTIEKAIHGCRTVYDPGNLPTVSEEVQDELSALSHWRERTRWNGRPGPTDHDVYGALLGNAWTHGKPHPTGGVETAPACAT